MEYECSKENINPDIIDTTNQENEFQGSLRFGRINTKALYERIKTDSEHYSKKYINIVFTQLNYTDNKLETTEGRQEIVVPDYINKIYLSDRKDEMEVI